MQKLIVLSIEQKKSNKRNEIELEQQDFNIFLNRKI